MYILKNWSIVNNGNVVLSGTTYNNDNFEDGTKILTSKLVDIDTNNMIAETLNSKYKLEDMSDGFKHFMDKNNYNLEKYSSTLKENKKNISAYKWNEFINSKFLYN